MLYGNIFAKFWMDVNPEFPITTNQPYVLKTPTRYTQCGRDGSFVPHRILKPQDNVDMTSGVQRGLQN